MNGRGALPADAPIRPATGGRAMVDAMAGPQIEALFRETSSYYLVSLPVDDRETGFQRLTVRLVGEDAEVRTRPGFFVAGPDGPARDAGVELGDHLLAAAGIAGDRLDHPGNGFQIGFGAPETSSTECCYL